MTLSYLLNLPASTRLSISAGELRDLAHQEILVLTQLLGRCTTRLHHRVLAGRVTNRTFTSRGVSP